MFKFLAQNLLFFFILFSLSCTKDKTPKHNFIIFGKQSNVNIHSINTIFTGEYQNAQFFDIDVNLDNIPDIRLLSEVWGAPSTGQHPRAQIWSLQPNCALHGFLADDTTFLHVISDTIVSVSGSVAVYSSSYFSCQSNFNDDGIFSIIPAQFSVQSKKVGDTLFANQFFKSSNCLLIDASYSIATFPIVQNDTTFYSNSYYQLNCKDFPQDQFYYIGFKLVQQNTEKLGWIKIRISNNNKIELIESAIQN